MGALALAILFHETYERLAPSFGYATRDDTKQFDPTTPNGKLMVAVCAEILAHQQAEQGVQSDICPVCGGDGVQNSGVRGPRSCIACDGTGKCR